MGSRTLFALVCIACLAMLESPRASAAVTLDRADAFRFLEQSTFGPTPADIDHLEDLAGHSDPYPNWIDDQMAVAPSLLLPVLQAKRTSGTTGNKALHAARQEAWFRTAVIGPDQLRQRVAFALSEIMVVSQHGALYSTPLGLAGYYDVLTRNAFGNFRQLLEEVTLHPAMGVYLSMLGNQQPDAEHNIRPDENYARELLQLFTIGLVQLNSDGSTRTDGSGAPIATYDQSVIEGFANVFTGWNYAGAKSFATAKKTIANQTLPMKAYSEQHSPLAKRLLDYPGAVQTELPPAQTAAQDLAAALDNIFNHPNVGPFISRRLIQRLVTSNPSPAYVRRVASVFDDDGTGRRGELGPVVRSILLDPEARPDLQIADDAAGKVKEPLLRLTQLWRAYDASAKNGTYSFVDADLKFGQGHLLSPSVFNFFTPDYEPQGEIAELDFVAPEMQIATESLNTQVTNYLYTQVFSRNSTVSGLRTDYIVIDIAPEAAIASDPDALVALLAEKLLGSRISTQLAAEARAGALRWPSTKPGSRVAEAMYLIVTSPEFAVQR
jgi:uncharacterized protein (DUF1800 family)